jgi:hypothetical protein
LYSFGRSSRWTTYHSSITLESVIDEKRGKLIVQRHVAAKLWVPRIELDSAVVSDANEDIGGVGNSSTSSRDCYVPLARGLLLAEVAGLSCL